MVKLYIPTLKSIYYLLFFRIWHSNTQINPFYCLLFDINQPQFITNNSYFSFMFPSLGLITVHNIHNFMYIIREFKA